MNGLMLRRQAMLAQKAEDSGIKDYTADWIPDRTNAFSNGISFNFSDDTTAARYPTNVDEVMVDSLYFICKSASAVTISGVNSGANPSWAARFATRDSGWNFYGYSILADRGVVNTGGYYYPYFHITKKSVHSGATAFNEAIAGGKVTYNIARGNIKMSVPSNLDWWVIQSDTFDASIVPLLPIH